jgi:hypothetical protein
MSSLLDVSEKFVKVIEEYMPELKDRIVFFGQQWQEPKDGKPYVIISILDSDLMNFTEGEKENEWARNINIILHVYGRNDCSVIAEKLAFCPDETPFKNMFLENGIGVFSNRKVRNLTGIEGSTPEYRYDVAFTLKFIGKSKGTGAYFESGGEIKGTIFEQ